jgi:hypothetical protein
LIPRTSIGVCFAAGNVVAQVPALCPADVRVVFTARPEVADYARGLGEFISERVNAGHVGMVIEWLRTPEEPA